MNNIKSVCVFCAASRNVHPAYCRSARRIGEILASHKVEIRYGGSTNGLMGQLAEGALQHHGKITGVITDFLQSQESPHPGITRLLVVSSMRERKKRMRENTDAVIALPGSTGTLEELMEVISLKRLGFYSKPIVILNCKNYFSDFIAFFNRMIEERFLAPRYRKIFSAVASPDEVYPALQSAPAWVPGNDCQC